MALDLILGIGFGFAAAVQPGPLQAFLISRSLHNGWRRTLLAAGAPLLSDIPIIILALWILNSLPDWMESFLHLAGGVFLLYLAWGAIQSYRRYAISPFNPGSSIRQNFFQAVAVNLLNPNPYLSWSLVMGPLLLKGWREAPGHGLMLLAGFYGAMIGVNGGIVILFSALRKFGPRISRLLVGISALALVGFGLYQLWLGVVAFQAG